MKNVFYGVYCHLNLQQIDGPAFTTAGKTYKVVTQDTIVLPCDVINLGNYVLVWKRGIAVLTAGTVKVTPDPRIQLIDGYNLQIRDVQTHDAGNYICQIGTMVPLEITHTLEILVPPRIHHVTSGGNVEVKKGQTVTLECRASGNPVPSVAWSRKNNVLPSGEKSREGSSITIEQATRHQAGTYLCTASNGVGDSAIQSINLHVLYPPEVEVERSWVHSGEGFEAQLVCIVHADPPSDVLWYRDTLRLDTTERRSFETRGSRHTLIIRKVQASDFGNYSCVADNTLGKMRQYLQLSGKPNQVAFNSNPVSRYHDSYNISWIVNSYTPIEEFKLFFRRIPETGNQDFMSYHQYSRKYEKRENSSLDHSHHILHNRIHDWNDVILPAIPSELFSQQMSYLIRGLEPSSQYEARVQARNRFGWNQISEIFRFSTRAIGYAKLIFFFFLDNEIHGLMVI
ncbi:limbic system-associated membrane protein precursor, putative [Pediculus humanus corporis]|uniref:Limbic system-associated membrane protein, putative n=1 Tax=Pediculus humanus subsp. corporis TaxID=121224 RepID=E0VY29_PEDHC|nr:limbic system-associated membrane protein precursor, putative [Pediculus humanus corporis]EEB18285.1 limbic system-associated membrane protein precursor, putative [Pediculus humanus corporis]